MAFPFFCFRNLVEMIMVNEGSCGLIIVLFSLLGVVFSDVTDNSFRNFCWKEIISTLHVDIVVVSFVVSSLLKFYHAGNDRDERRR